MSNEKRDLLLAELDRLEALARAAEGIPWRVETGYDAAVVDARNGARIAAFTDAYPEGPIPMDEEDARHITEHDPERSLRRIAGVRAVVAKHVATHGSNTCRACGGTTYGGGCSTISVLYDAYYCGTPG